ncbi:MAG: tRNA (adenosine(37)-N6)-threonylcarbamoyltransferase complex dimerization subunit type 1 TsaB [Anaerolineae bacterium]
MTDLMTGLIVDTSTRTGVVALTREAALLDSIALPEDLNLSKSLVPAIHSLLFKFSLTPQEIVFIAAGQGPGSFTGTRVGAAVALSLAFALDIPLIGFDSPFLFLPSLEGPFNILLPTKDSFFYLIQGSIEKGLLKDLSEDRAVSKEMLLSRLLPKAPIITDSPLDSLMEKELCSSLCMLPTLNPSIVALSLYQQFIMNSFPPHPTLALKYLRQLETREF